RNYEFTVQTAAGSRRGGNFPLHDDDGASSRGACDMKALHAAALALLLLGAAPAGAATVSVTNGLAIEGPGAAGTVQVAVDVANGIESLDLRIAFQSGTVAIGSQPVAIGVAS